MPKTGRNIYKRKDGRWEGRYEKSRDDCGKIIYGSVYGKTCSEVKKRLSALYPAIIDSISNAASVPAALTAAQQQPLATVSDTYNFTFAEVSEQWLSVISLKVKASTYAGYSNALNLHIIPVLGKQDIQGLSALDISCFARDKLEKGRMDGKGGLSPKTVRDMLSVIKAILDYARSENILSKEFPVTYPKHQQQVMRVLSRQEQSALEKVLTADMDIHKLGILLCLYTGIRIGELCALRWRNVSPEFDILSIQQTLQRIKNMGNDNQRTKIIIDAPKTSCSIRQIPIPKFIAPYLGEFARNGHSYFLENDNCSFTEPRTMQNHFAKHIKTANILDANYHSLRHTFATRCIEAGVDIKSLSEMLGHANVSITLNRYVHSSLEQKREGMNKLEQYIGI